MKFLRIYSILILIALCYTMESASAAELKEQSSSLNEQIQNVVDEERGRYQLPALSLSIKLPEEKLPRIGQRFIFFQGEEKDYFRYIVSNWQYY